MPRRALWEALSLLLMVLCGHSGHVHACPHPCACYVPSEVHCTFRSLAAVPAGISKHVERINLGCVFKFSYNKLRVIAERTLQGLSSLVRLYVDHNQIEFLHPQALRGLTALRLVNLEGNLLHQVHPAAFSTFSFLGHFQLSTVRHLYLGDNALASLPAGLLQNMPLLDNLYLHGNPWACGCHMAWFRRWGARDRGVLKCKKDKAYEGGQLCATCFSPRRLLKQEIHKVGDVACTKPLIQSPLRLNSSASSEEETGDEEEDVDDQSFLDRLQLPAWNVSLNMTDEHGNTVDLTCRIKQPSELAAVHLNQTEPLEVEVNATVALDFECPMTREKYEKLWKLIAYYSEVPLKLHREPKAGKEPRVPSEYRQDVDDEALYYTGVRARILAEPAWVTQPTIDLQLDRRQSMARKVLLSYHAQFSQTVSSKDLGRAGSRSWVMVELDGTGQTTKTILEGTSFQLSCNVRASQSPSIFWVLPDGSVLHAPVDDPDSRFSVLSSGQLRIRSAEYTDSGLYHCVAQVPDETDRMVYRISVQTPVSQPPERHTVTVDKNPGESVTLPCSALAIPEAQLSWVLPDRRILNGASNTSHTYLLDSGALYIPKARTSDSGHYRCVAVNLQGTDHFTAGVTVNRRGSGRTSKRGRRPGSRGRGDVVEDEGGSGVGSEDHVPRRTVLPGDTDGFMQRKDESEAEGGKPRKGRRKWKLWKNPENKEPEAKVAEGRRGFESRRKINMSNKQINPERWADILARVRGKNVPRVTNGPQVTQSTTPSSVAVMEVGPISPAPPPPSVSPPQTAIDTEELSADMTVVEEDELSTPLSTRSSTKVVPEHDHHEVIFAEPEVTRHHLEVTREKTEDDSSSAEEDSSISTSTSLPSESTSSSPWTQDTFYEELVLEEVVASESGPTAPGFGPLSPVTDDTDEGPLDAVSVGDSQTEAPLYSDLETDSQALEEVVEDLTTTDFTPTPTWQTVDSRLPESERELDGPVLIHRQGHTDNPHAMEGDVGAQGMSSMGQEYSQMPGQGDVLVREPTDSGQPTDEGSEHRDHVSPLNQIREAASAPRVDGSTVTASTRVPKPGATPPATLTTRPPRRKSSGRRKSRPHKWRHRQKQAQATTPSPMEMPSASPVRGSEVPGQAEGPLVLISEAKDGTADVHKQWEAVTPGKPVTKGMRRKHSRKQNKHRDVASTMSSRDTVPKTTSLPEKMSYVLENKHKHGATQLPEMFHFSTEVPPKARNPHETGRAGDSLTITPKVHLPFSQLQDKSVVTDQPISDGGEMKKAAESVDHDDHKSSTPVPTELGTNIISLSAGLTASTVEELIKDPSGSPETLHWPAPSPAQPWRPETSFPDGGVQETQTDPSRWKKLENPYVSSESPSSTIVSTLAFEKLDVSTTLSAQRPELHSSHGDTTSHGQDRQMPTLATVPPAVGPQAHTPTPGSTGEPTSTSPPKVMVSLVVETTTIPTSLPSGTSPTPTEPKEKVVFTSSMGILKPQDPQLHNEGAQDQEKPNGFSPPAFQRFSTTFSPKEGWMEEVKEDGASDTLPRGPAVWHQDRRGHISHQPGITFPQPTPSRWTSSPPPKATQSSSRYFMASPPARHTFAVVTNKPEVTAYPPKPVPGSKFFVSPKFASRTTPAPWPGPQSHSPKPHGDLETSLFNGHAKVFGSNNIPDQRRPVEKPPGSRLPPHLQGKYPFFLNKTLAFSQIAGTLKPPMPTFPSSVTRERKVQLGSHHKVFSQSVFHIDFGPPAPPLSHPPRATMPPLTNRHVVLPVHPTWNAIPSTASPGQPFRNFPQSGSRLFSSIGGPPASKFWMLGEKPQIVTKSPKTVSVTVDADAVFPCEATGKPMPFVTWTKVSTGALLTPNTRLHRFEVLKNGTLVIRKVQQQDHGQYLCTAKNLHGVDTMPVHLFVTTQQPQILASHYQDVTVYLGDTIAMECLAKGTPVPQISWIFPDRTVWHSVSPVESRVTLHENRTLSIKEASFSDRGVYKCVASNAAGADSLAIRLHVAALPPVIHQEKRENISLPPGLSIHVHCTAKAAPPPTVRWVLGDGTQVRASQFVRGNLFVFPNGTLYIRHLAPKDSGRYDCVATNLVGSARRTVQLTVQPSSANARITATSPRRTDVRYGATLRLDCSASGDPWPRTQWRLPSQRMVDPLFSFDPRIKVFPNGTLVVRAVTQKDSGNYLCVARNEMGDDFVVLKVNVVMQPAKIEHQEHDQRVPYGSDLQVDCVATGLPDPEISWNLPDGSQVMQSDEGGAARTKRFVVFHNGTLYFNEVGLRQAGEYTCVAQNQVGKDEMKVRVNVVAAPAEISNKTYSVVQVPYGDVVTVSCHAKGDPAPRVTWLSPTHRLIPASSEKYEVSADGTLVIRKAQRSDSGNYTCVVRNSAGEDRKAVWVQVRVQAPQINGSPNAITTVREVAPGGSRKLIDCRAEGIPAPRALWAFPEGVVLPAPYYGNRVTVHRNGTLDIRSLRPSDSVQLACIARNEGGEAKLIVQLTVLDPAEKPVFRDPVDERIIASAGHTISLNCSAAGAPAPTLLWLLPNGTELASGRRLRRFFHQHDGRLHISSLSPADAGPYRCVARNPSGHSERLVSVQVGPQPAAHNAVSVTHGDTLHLNCPLRITAGRPSPVSWTLPSGLVLGVPQAVGRFVLWDNGTLTVREASALDRGSYACRVDTAVASVPVIVIAYPPRITSEAAPVVYVRTGSAVHLSCLAVGIPRARVSWELPDGARLTAGAHARVHANKILQPQGALTVQLTSSRDAGLYKCSAENAVGRDSKTTYVHVF
ncbi:PREDICTED: matrix-remodeling-associated protein 5 [Elephantulus edwardii]|uniref:matrix-remodeling-associated protein 5 n=1 Tax=Elephantulus edwardii TaxID=28737 RepID=UPI0003F089AE|nr:PREDICTED: matrix-remodeling-associated protein 5 [Elephantulus edwardii]